MTISWREQIDVRTSHGAGHRMWGWRSTDNDSAAERCSRSTLTLLHWWLCIINQLQWQQFVVELCPHREWEFPFPVFPQNFCGNGGREWEWKTHFRTLYSLHCAVVVWSTGQANEMQEFSGKRTRMNTSNVANGYTREWEGIGIKYRFCRPLWFVIDRSLSIAVVVLWYGLTLITVGVQWRH